MAFDQIKLQLQHLLLLDSVWYRMAALMIVISVISDKFSSGKYLTEEAELIDSRLREKNVCKSFKMDTVA